MAQDPASGLEAPLKIGLAAIQGIAPSLGVK
jgi:hypothetical protein